MPQGTKNKIVPGGGLHHIALQAHNFEESFHLYKDVLGMTAATEFMSSGRKIVLLDMGDGSLLELFAPKAGTTPLAQGGEPILHIALATSDARSAIELARGAGYEVTVEPKDVNLNGLEATIAFFRGPSGELVEFFQVH